MSNMSKIQEYKFFIRYVNSQHKKKKQNKKTREKPGTSKCRRKDEAGHVKSYRT